MADLTWRSAGQAGSPGVGRAGSGAKSDHLDPDRETVRTLR
jgi:hypothetical protein